MSEKVFWSDSEKRTIVQRAIEIQRKRPDLAGLPLLREAMKALPANRRRKLVTLSQVDWFEEAVHTEVRLQAAESKPEVMPTLQVWPEGNPYVPLMRENIDTNRRTNQALETVIIELRSLKTLIQDLATPIKLNSRPQNGQGSTNDQGRSCSLDDT